MSDNIQVAIKVRPLISREREDNLTEQWIINGNTLCPKSDSGSDIFYFDHVFDTQASNIDVYKAVLAPITQAAVNGVNGTIFAYGQTSSGKTYTMMGTKHEKGVVQLVINDIFRLIASHSNRIFLLRASFIEIYNEKIYDLLDSKSKQINVCEDPNGIVKLIEVKEEISDTPENLMDLMRRGEKNRRIGETNMNERSSRSHTIFRIIIESRTSNDPEGAIQVAHLNLVDLAGSERVSQTGAKGIRLREGTHINLSLLTLSRVISQLSESTDTTRFISFRDSKLTRILQSSLGGNAKTVIICAITPASLEESYSTLSFASRAKSIKNKPKVNEIVSNDTLLKRYAKQITMLQQQLEREKNANINLQSNHEEASLANRRLQERICLLQKFMLKPQTTPVKQMLPAVGYCESVEKTLRRQTWCAPAKSLFAVPQRAFSDDVYVDEFINKTSFNDISINNSAAFIPGEHFEFNQVFNLNNSLLLRDIGTHQKETESIPMEQFELDIIECVKNQINDSLCTLRSGKNENNRPLDDEKSSLEKMRAELEYYKSEYETLKEFVKDENVILNEHVTELEKQNDNLQDLLKSKEAELHALKFQLNALNGPALKSKSLDDAITKLMQKKDEIMLLQQDIDLQINHDTDKNTKYLKRLHNEFTEVAKILDVNVKVVIALHRTNNRCQMTIKNLKARKLQTIVENEDAMDDLNSIQDIVTDTLQLQSIIHEMNNYIDYLEQPNEKMETEYEILRHDFEDKIKKQTIDLHQLIIDNKKLQLEKLTLEQKLSKEIEFKKQIEQEKEFWDELQRKNKSLKQQVDQLQETKNDFDLKLKQVEDSCLIRIKEATDELQSKLNQLEEDKKQSECELKVLKECRSRLEDFDSKLLSVNGDEFKQEIQLKEVQINELETEIEEIKKLNLELNHDNQKLLKQFGDSSKELTTNEEIIVNLKSEIAFIKQLILEKNQAIDNYQDKIQDLVKKIQENEFKCQDLMKIERELKESINSFEKDIISKNSRITELETLIESTNSKHECKIRDLRQQLEEMTTLYSQTTENSAEKILELKDELENSKNIKEKTDVEINNLKIQLENSLYSLELKTREIIELKEELESVKKSVTKELEVSAKSGMELENSNVCLKQELKCKTDRIIELESEVENTRQDVGKSSEATINTRMELEKSIISLKQELTSKIQENEFKCQDLMKIEKELKESINSFEKDIISKNSRITELETLIESTNSKHECKIRDLRQQLEEMTTLYSKTTENSAEKILELKDELENSKNIKEKTDVEINNLKKQLENSLYSLELKTREIIELKEELESSKKSVTKEIEESAKSGMELENSNVCLKQELKCKTDRIIELEREIENTRQNLTKILEDVGKSSEATIKTRMELEKSIISLKQELTSKTDRIIELEEQIENIKQSVTKKIEISEKSSETNMNKQMEFKIISFKQELESKEAKIIELEEEIKESECNYKTQIQTLIKERDKLIKSNKLNNHYLKQTRCELLAIKAQYNNLEGKYNEKKISSQELESKLTKLEAESFEKGMREENTLKQTIENKELTIKGLERDFQNQEKKLKDLTFNYKILEQTYDERLESCKNKIVEYENKMQSFTNEINQKQRYLEQQNQEIFRYEYEIKKLNIQLGNIENQNKDFTDKIKSKDTEIYHLNTKISEFKSMNQKLIQDLKGETNENQMQILKNQLEKMENQYKDITDKLELKDTKIRHLNDQILELNSTNQKLKLDFSDKLKLKDTEIHHLHAKIIEHESINQRLNQNLKTKENQVHLEEQQRTIIDNYESKMKNLENQHKNLLEKLKSKGIEIHNLNTKILELNALNQKLNQDLKAKENLIIDLNNKLLPLKNYNGKMNEEKENCESSFERKLKECMTELQKVAKEKEKLVQTSKMYMEKLKQAYVEKKQIQVQLQTLETKYKDKETLEMELRSTLKKLKDESDVLQKDTELRTKMEQTHNCNHSKIITNLKEDNMRTKTSHKQLELEVSSLKTEHEVNVKKIHELEDRISELRIANQPSNAASPKMNRKNRLSSSRRNELFDENRRSLMEQDLFEAQHQLTIPLNNAVTETQDKAIQADIFQREEYLRQLEKKKNFYKELAVLRKRELKKLQNEALKTNVDSNS